MGQRSRCGSTKCGSTGGVSTVTEATFGGVGRVLVVHTGMPSCITRSAGGCVLRGGLGTSSTWMPPTSAGRCRLVVGRRAGIVTIVVRAL